MMTSALVVWFVVRRLDFIIYNYVENFVPRSSQMFLLKNLTAMERESLIFRGPEAVLVSDINFVKSFH